MKKSPDYYLFLISVILIIISCHILQKPAPVPKNNGIGDIPAVRDIFGDGAKGEPVSSEKEWIVVTAGGKRVGAVITTSPHSDHIVGYSGSTPLVIAVDENDRIKKVILLENQETPAFVEKVANGGFFDQWNGLHWREALNRPLDAVTGATRTSTSVYSTFRHRLTLLDPAIKLAKVESGYTFGWKDAAALILCLMGLLMCFGPAGNRNKLRIVQMVLSVLFLGFFSGTMFSLSLMRGWTVNGIPAGGGVGVLLLVILAVAVPVITGRNYYCYFVCPFGAFQELLKKVFPWKWKINKKLDGLFRWIRYVALTLAALSLILGFSQDPGNTEPFSAFLFTTAAPAAIVIALVSLVLSTGINRPWCNYACGAGAFLDLLRRPLDAKAENCPEDPAE